VKPALLDVNVLLALAWPNHQHHAEAHSWFAREAKHGWATIALTQLAFVRLSSNSAYTSSAVSPREAAALLRDLLDQKHHRFWTSPAAVNTEIFAHVMGHKQVNDAYLVEVARQQKGRLVTFDRRLVAHAPGEDVVQVIDQGQAGLN
jgi:toxin-antitoxin system PIN domain toxin